MTRKTTYRLTFRSVMVRNEFRAVRGKNNRTVGYLFLILFITFITFGFSRNTLNYQRKLANDPFSNWINLNYHAGTRDSLAALHAQTTDEAFRNRYHIRGAYFYNKGMVSIRPFGKDRADVQYEARTVDTAGKVIRDLLQLPGSTRYFPDSMADAFRFEPNGVIISSRLAKETGLDRKTTSFIRMKFPAGDFVPVPVLAIVDELPDLSDIVYTNLFYCKSMNPGFYDRDNAYYRIFVENMDTSEILHVLDEVCRAFNILDASTVQTSRLVTGNRPVLNWKIEIGVQDQPMQVSEMNARLEGLASLQNHRFGQFFELSRDSSCDASSFFHDYLAIEFSDLEKIRDFTVYLRERLDLQLNLEVLAARENYLYTGNLAAGTMVLLMILSLVAVSVYLSAVIRNHLLSIKKNLGNFLAFGAANATLMQLYIFISVRILCMAMIPAVIAAYCFGEFFEFFILGKLLVVDGSQDYFSIANTWFVLFLLLILVVAVFRTWLSVRKILKQSPGNLIYERDHGS